MLPGRPAADDVHSLQAGAQPDAHVLRLRHRRGGQPFGKQQRRELHDAARHDSAQPGAAAHCNCGLYPTRVSLTWTASVDNLSQVYYTQFLDGTEYFGGEIGVRERTVLDLSPATTYSFTITARDAYGNSVDSNVLSVTTPAATDTEPPTVPMNLRLSPESSAPEIWLDWDQSTDNVDPQSQILYDVYINGELDHVALGRGDTITYCRGEGPDVIAIRAVDSTGNASALSNEITFDC